MGGELSRGDLLRRRLFGRAAPIRPPWAVSEAKFIDLCSRCGDCLSACETEILAKGDGGFPTVDFGQGECTFCGACADVCETGAILREPVNDAAPWRLRLSVGDACLSATGIACRVCEDQCEPRAIRFKPSAIPTQPDIDQDLCTGCGACVAPCPVAAISLIPAETGSPLSQTDPLHSKEALHA
jgi:ferredoxin-type protein NapF